MHNSGQASGPHKLKSLSSGLFAEVWKGAREQLSRAKSLAFIGYSLPTTDLLTQALLRVDYKSASPLGRLIITNPDPEARSRIRATVHRRIDRRTRVMSFDRLGDYDAYVQSRN